jgi:uncharacterized membrane protein YphA (DoxX/SURF4 family)
VAIVVQGAFYLMAPNPTLATWLMGLTTIAAGALLLAGFLTPMVGVAVAVGSIGIGLSLLPASIPTLFDSKLEIVFAVTMLIGIIVLGPGAFSLDARLFGRREVIIPRATPHSRPQAE